MSEKLRIFDSDKYCCSKRGALCIANNIRIELTDDQLNEIAHRRKDLNKEYGSLSDEQVVFTTLDPEQMDNFRKFYSHVSDPPAELIKPFRPPEPTEITKINKPSEFIESFAS